MLRLCLFGVGQSKRSGGNVWAAHVAGTKRWKSMQYTRFDSYKGLHLMTFRNIRTSDY